MSRVLFRDMDARGTNWLAPAELDRIVKDTVAPELDATHSMAVVAATSTTGADVALLVRKTLPAGELTVEACWRHDWANGENETGAKVIWKW